jgi:hypothetical protein
MSEKTAGRRPLRKLPVQLAKRFRADLRKRLKLKDKPQAVLAKRSASTNEMSARWVERAFSESEPLAIVTAVQLAVKARELCRINPAEHILREIAALDPLPFVLIGPGDAPGLADWIVRSLETAAFDDKRETVLKALSPFVTFSRSASAHDATARVMQSRSIYEQMCYATRIAGRETQTPSALGILHGKYRKGYAKGKQPAAHSTRRGR